MTAVEELQAAAPDLFHCQCTMKRPMIRERCNRIRWRISGNTCLGWSISVQVPDRVGCDIVILN